MQYSMCVCFPFPWQEGRELILEPPKGLESKEGQGLPDEKLSLVEGILSFCEILKSWKPLPKGKKSA